MKRRGLQALKLLGFALSVLALFGLLYRIFSWKDTMGLPGSSVRELSYLEKDTVDVAFVGNSHVYFGISPAALWNRYGISGYDMSISAMDKDSMYYHLKYLLKTQSPKVVMAEVTPLSYEKQLVKSNEYRNMLGLPFSADAVRLVNAYADEEDRMDYITRFPIIHTRYTELEREDFLDTGFATFGKGERVELGRISGVDLSVATEYKECTELSDRNRKWMEDMKALSEQEGFRLIFFVMPYSIPEETQAIMNGAEQYAAKLGIEFWDLGRSVAETGIDPNAHYVDAEHLNAYGAQTLTEWLGEQLIAMEDFTDHRNDPRYHTWDLDAAYTQQRMAFADYQATMDSGDWLQAFGMLVQMPNLECLVSLDGSWEEVPYPLAEYLEVLGIEPDALTEGGAWVGFGNEYRKLRALGEQVYHAFDRYTEAKLSDDAILVGKKNYKNCNNGLNVVLYDRSDQKVVYDFAIGFE